jgi:hypothetical protein
MTIAEIVALGTMGISAIGAFASAYAVVMGVRNHQGIHDLHISTNGMKDQLVAEVRAGATAQGVKTGRDEVHAEMGAALPPRSVS